jgi:hypothetical protein
MRACIPKAGRTTNACERVFEYTSVSTYIALLRMCVHACAYTFVCVFGQAYLTTLASRCAVPLPRPTTKSWGPSTAPGVREVRVRVRVAEEG